MCLIWGFRVELTKSYWGAGAWKTSGGAAFYANTGRHKSLSPHPDCHTKCLPVETNRNVCCTELRGYSDAGNEGKGVRGKSEISTSFTGRMSWHYWLRNRIWEVKPVKKNDEFYVPGGSMWRMWVWSLGGRLSLIMWTWASSVQSWLWSTGV